MQKNETGLFSTIKKFIRGNAVKVGLQSVTAALLCYICFKLILHTHVLKQQPADDVKHFHTYCGL